MVGRVWWQMNRGDAFQQPAGLVETGQHLGVVEPGAARDDRDLLGAGFALESVQGADDLFGVLVPLDRVQLDLLAGQGESTEERLGRLLPVHGRFGALAFREPHAAGLGLVLQAHLVWRIHLPAGVQQVLDLGLHLCHASGDGLLVAVLVERVRQLETQPAEPQEQLVGGVRPVLGTGSSRRHVSLGRPRIRRGRPSGRAAGPRWS